MDRSKNAIRGMAGKNGGKRGFAVRCLALHNSVNELKLATLIQSLYGSEGTFWK